MSKVYLTESAAAIVLNDCTVPGCKAQRYRTENGKLHPRCEKHMKELWVQYTQQRRGISTSRACAYPDCNEPRHNTGKRHYSRCAKHLNVPLPSGAARKYATKPLLSNGLSIPEAFPFPATTVAADPPTSGWKWWERPADDVREQALSRHLAGQGKVEVLP